MLLADALYAVIISIFFTLMAGTNDSNPGIIAYFDHTVMAFWSFVLMVPVAMRRWKPQMATLLFAGLVVVQLAFGPSMVYADLMAPWMLYSAIVYADLRNSKAFIVLAVAIGALASPVIIWSADAGPILNQGVPFDGLSPLETCSGTYIYGLSGDCATTIATSSVAIFIFIAVYLFAAIIVAYWQRARRITVSMMHERNDALQAKEDEERHIAALAERARIARDMHDVVAHTLSIIIIQSDGGRYAGANNPALARQTMETIRHESERALHDMKRLLGVFGGSDHADYADVDALIDQANSLSDTASSIRDMLGYQNMVTPDAYASMVYSAELLNYQSEQMLLMGDSVTEVTPEMLHVQVVETGRASLISGAQTAMIGYEQLLLSKEQLESSLELLEAVYQSTVTQANVGMATQADVLSAKQNLESAQAGMLTIEANEQNIRQTLCTMLGWAYNASPEIRPVPAADESRIAVMNPETDKEKAIANNFTLKYNVLSLDTLTDGSAEKANMERTVAQQKEQIASKLTNLYNDVLQKQSELATAKAAYELEQTKMNAASQKLQLGTIGRLEYLQQENSLKNQEIAVKNAELALFQSMETYDWALEGNLSLT